MKKKEIDIVERLVKDWESILRIEKVKEQRQPYLPEKYDISDIIAFVPFVPVGWKVKEDD